MIGADSPYEHEIVVEGDDRAEECEVHERADVGRRSVDGERLNSRAENGGCQAPDNCRMFMFRQRNHSHTTAMQRLDKSLNGIGIFEGISLDAQRTLAKRCSWNTYKANQQIVGHLDTSRQGFFLAEGEARAIIYSLSGKQVTFRDIAAGGGCSANSRPSMASRDPPGLSAQTRRKPISATPSATRRCRQ